MKKWTSILLAVLMVSLMVFSPVSALAEQVTYTAIPGTTVDFNKYLVFDADANVPNVTFEYEIAAGEAVAAANGKAAVLAGVGTPTVGTAAFTTADSKLTEVAAGDTVTLDAGEAYVKKAVTIDFSGCSFDEPGIYRYVLTEKETADAMGTTYDTQLGDGFTAKTRYVDVYVQDENNILKVMGYVIHKDTEAPAVSDAMGTTASGQDNKSDGFVNEYATKNLTFDKTVTGNQGSKDKYFAFTVTISGAVVGTKYDVDISGAEAKSGHTSATIADNQDKDNVTELTVGADGTVTQIFYLKHGQSITIKGLAEGTQYSITENAEDYKSTKTDSGNGTIAAEDVTVNFVNERSGAVPTGVMLTVVPGVVIVAIAVVALVLLGRRKKEENT